MRRTALLAVVILLSLLAGQARAEPEEEEVLLRSGVKLHGRVIARESVRGRRMAQIETDFGTIRIDTRQLRRAPEGEPTAGVFFFSRIRVSQIRGTVEKRTAGSNAWVPVRLEEEYGPVINAPDAIIRPGDTVRTDFGSYIDLMPHKNVWLRIDANSVVEFPAERGDASIILRSGRTLQRITGKPRGKTFVIQTPSRLLIVGGTEFLVEVGEQERVAVTHGEVEVEGGARVKEGKAGSWEGKGEVEVGTIDADDKESLTVEAIRLPEEDMVYVPSGTYRMGDKEREDAPPRKVTLSGYLIDRREVTGEEYARFAKATGAPVPAYFVGGKPPPGQERLPVHGLTAGTALRYVAWAGKRLPTEAQWEAAARGPKALKWPWGNRALAHDKLPLVKYGEIGKAEEFPLVPVDEETPDVSPFGIRALASSVPEWCRDWYAKDSYTKGADRDPQGPPGGIWKVIRGGTDRRGPSVSSRTAAAEENDETGAGARGVVELEP